MIKFDFKSYVAPFINQEDVLLIKDHDSREDFRGQR